MRKSNFYLDNWSQSSEASKALKLKFSIYVQIYRIYSLENKFWSRTTSLTQERFLTELFIVVRNLHSLNGRVHQVSSS